MTNKSIIRKDMIHQLCQIDKTNITQQNNIKQFISQNIISLLNNINNNINKIAVYHAHQWEITLNNIIDYLLSQNKEIYQPVANKTNKQMYLTKYNNDKRIFVSDLEYNTIKNNQSILWDELDIIFIPSVAVDKKGYRLGRGGGYYDATLKSVSHKNIILCGVGYDIQYTDDIHHDEWDIRLDYFISENNIINFKG